MDNYDVTRSYRDFRGNLTCKKYRKMKDGLDLVKETGNAYRRKVVHSEIIIGIASGMYDISQVEDLVDQGISSQYDLTATDEARKKVESAQLLRYLMCEDLDSLRFDLSGMKLDCGNGIFIRDFAPNAIRVNKQSRTVEAIWYRPGTPDINERTGMTPANHEKMQQWFNCWLGMLYAKKTAEQELGLKAGEPFTAIGSQYFLKKTTDKDGIINDKDFFSKKGGNVVSITREFSFGSDFATTDEDRIIHKFMDECVEGIENCTGMCKECDLRSQCNYTKAPVRADRKNICSSLKKEFNTEQKRVIAHRKGVCVVNARPGSGKTACVVARTCKMIEEGIDPKTILHLSFTDNAVSELKQRLKSEMAARGRDLSEDDFVCTTNNGFADMAIREFYKELGYSRPPKILQPDEEMQVIEDLCNKAPLQGINAGSLKYNAHTCIPEMLIICQAAFEIIRTKQLDVNDPDTPEILRNHLSEKGLDLTVPETLASLIGLYKENDKIMKNRCLITYADQEPLMFKFLSRHPGYFESLGYRHIVVDEFQDSNMVQAETLRLLISTPSYESLLMVGDVSQSIYKFRGTSSEIMLNIADILDTAVESIDLATNYRSTQEICTLANRLDALNEGKNTPMVSLRGKGLAVSVKGFYKSRDALHENEDIIGAVKNKIFSEGVDPKDICIMCYKRSELMPFSEALTEAGIPWVSKNPMELCDNSRVNGALALADAFYESDATIHYFDYMVAKYDGEMFRLKTKEEIMEEVDALKELFKEMQESDLDLNRKRIIFHSLLEDLRSEEEDELFEYFLNLLCQKPDLKSELAYTRTFKKYGSRLNKKMEQDYEGVTLVTAHSSKGMEWPIVYLSLSGFDNEALHKDPGKEEIEERRRVMYVAVTRAMNELSITGDYVAYGRKGDYTYNQFLREVFLALDKEDEYVPVEPLEAEKKKNRAKDLLLTLKNAG